MCRELLPIYSGGDRSLASSEWYSVRIARRSDECDAITYDSKRPSLLQLLLLLISTSLSPVPSLISIHRYVSLKKFEMCSRRGICFLDWNPRKWSNPTRQCCSQVRTWVSWQFWVNSGHGSIRNPPQKGAIWARQRTWRPRWPRNRFQNDPDAHSWMSPCQMDHMKAAGCSSQYLTK